jgi:hypothetical protein
MDETPHTYEVFTKALRLERASKAALRKEYVSSGR